ncbi:MAG TPA: hypothetical protein VLS51_00115, partial [Propionibacteriaceae bacterium]|nr:hypothetical protein [Propionibacteriaceae bacterium]
METVSSWRATYVPGRWVVLAGPTSLVVMQPAPAHMSGLVSDLWQDVVSAADVSDLAQRFTAFRLDLMPHFAAFFWDKDGMHSLVRGGLRAVDPDTGEVVAQGDGFRTWNEVGLQGIHRVRVDMDEPGDEPLLSLPLAVGAVLASSVTIDSTQTVPLVPPVTATGEVWTPALAEPAAEQSAVAAAEPAARVEPAVPFAAAPVAAAPAAAVAPLAAAAPGTPVPAREAAQEDAWGVRDAGSVPPVELSVDENHDGIPDAQQHGRALEDQQADDLTVPIQGAAPEPSHPDPFSLESAANPREDSLRVDVPASPFGLPQAPYPGPSFVAQPFGDQPFPEQPFTEQPFTAPYGSSQPGYPPFAPGLPLPTSTAVSPVPPPAPRRGRSPASSPAEPFIPGFSAGEGLGTESIYPSGVPGRAAGNDLVLATLCAYGHPNRPGSARCRVCGNAVDNGGPRLVQRPILAQLVTAQGARVDVAGTVLIGRAPQAKPGDDDAIAQTKTIEKVLVVRRTKHDVPWTDGRD